MNTRRRILGAAADLLAASPREDLSVPALCEAAETTPSAVFRLFSDRADLVAAVVEHGFRESLTALHATEELADPVQELEGAWDRHVAFAQAQPNQFRAMFMPGARAPTQEVREAHQFLRRRVEACRARGFPALDSDEAAWVLLAASTGAALGLITYHDALRGPAGTTLMRDIVIGAVLGIPTTAEGGPEHSAHAASRAPAAGE